MPRTRPPAHLNLRPAEPYHGDISAVRVGTTSASSTPSVEPTRPFFEPGFSFGSSPSLSLARPEVAAVREPETNDIRFRDSASGRSLYTPSVTRMPPPAYARKQSLVRPEDYLPTQDKASDMSFNPYVSPSWATKPDVQFDLDLASPEMAENALDRFDQASPAVPQSSIFEEKGSTYQLEYDTLNSKHRTLGGRPVVKSGDWRKNFQLKTAEPIFPRSSPKVPSPSLEKMEKSTADVYLGKGPEPNVFELERSEPDHSRTMRLSLGLITVMALQLAALLYLFMRVRYLVLAHQTSRTKFVAAWLFFVIELLYAYRSGAALIKSVWTYKTKECKRLRVKGDAFLPTVDVMIICTGQHSQVVMDTAMAAARLNWPVDRVRVLIIDDMSSEELQRRIESYASHRALHMTYHRRLKSSRGLDTSNYKAALINYGLTESRMNGRLAAEYVLILEAECIPDPDILRAMLPYMLKDPQLGLVRSRQGFYNLPTVMGSAFATFINAVEPSEQARSGFLMRRCAVDDVGGFPTGSSVEDGQLSTLLKGKGYHVKNLRETLQYGLVPDSFAWHLKQSLNRQLGPIRTARRFGAFCAGSRIKHVSSFGRLHSLFLAARPLLSVDILLSMVALPVALAYGQFLVPVTTVVQLNVLIRCLFALTMLERVHEILFVWPTHHSSVRTLLKSWIFMAPYQALNILHTISPIRSKQTLNTGAWQIEGNTRERDERGRKPFLARLGQSLAAGTWLHLAIISAVIAAIAVTMSTILKPTVAGLRTPHQAFLMLLLTVCWPSLQWINVLNGCWTPISCCLFPPTIPPRDHLLIREPITGVARPDPAWRSDRPFKQSRKTEISLAVISTCYITALFVLSFFHGFDI